MVNKNILKIITVLIIFLLIVLLSIFMNYIDTRSISGHSNGSHVSGENSNKNIDSKKDLQPTTKPLKENGSDKSNEVSKSGENTKIEELSTIDVIDNSTTDKVKTKDEAQSKDSTITSTQDNNGLSQNQDDKPIKQEQNNKTENVKTTPVTSVEGFEIVVDPKLTPFPKDEQQEINVINSSEENSNIENEEVSTSETDKSDKGLLNVELSIDNDKTIKDAVISSTTETSNQEKQEVLNELDKALQGLLEVVGKVPTVDETKLNASLESEVQP